MEEVVIAGLVFASGEAAVDGHCGPIFINYIHRAYCSRTLGRGINRLLSFTTAHFLFGVVSFLISELNTRRVADISMDTLFSTLFASLYSI